MKQFATFSTAEAEVPTEAGDGLLVAGKPFMIYPIGRHTSIDGREFDISKNAAKKLVADANARTQDIAILYEHGKDISKGMMAAGWVSPKAIELREDGIYATAVNWTRAAYDEIKGKVRRFISGSAYGSRENGAFVPEAFREITLCNIPALPTMTPLEASADEGEAMDPKIREKLIAVLGLDANATDEDLSKALDETEADLKAIEKADAAAEEEEEPPKKTVQELAAETVKQITLDKEIEEYIAGLVKKGVLTTKEEQAAALTLAKADFPAYKSLAASLPAKSPTKRVFAASADGTPLKRHVADFVGAPEHAEEFSADEGRFDVHRRAIAYMEANSMKSHQYPQAVIAVSRS